MKTFMIGLVLWVCSVVVCFAQDSLNVRRVGFCDTEHSMGVAVSGNYAYVADSNYGLLVIDITNPAAPTVVGFCDTPGSAVGVAVAGNYAYVADLNGGLRVIDISSPAVPAEAGFCSTPGHAWGVAVAGNYAYVTNMEYGLRVIEITNPSAPIEVGEFDTPGIAWWGMAVSGDLAYIGDGFTNGGLRIANITNPTAPTEAGFCATLTNAYGVAVAENYAYVANDSRGLRVIDITNPATPFEAGYFNTPGRTYGVAVAGNFAFVTNSGGGLRVIDITNPAAPTEAGFYDTPREFFGVTVAGNYAYVTDYNGLGIYDCSAATGGSCEADLTISLVPDNPNFPGVQSVIACARIAPNISTRIVVPVYNSTNEPTVSITAGCVDDPDCQPAEGWNLVLPWQYDANATSYFTTISRVGGGCCVTLSLDYVLPVELLSFEAVPGDRQVTLHWTTASETDNDHFDIERDGIVMGRVDATNSATGCTYNWSESNLINGREYTYSLISVSTSGEREVIGTASATPTMNAATITEYALHQNYPNPFNPETNITFDLVEAGEVTLSVYNSTGQTVATLVNGTMPSGRHSVAFDASNLPSGLYFYRLHAADFTAVKKMILMK